MLCEVIGKPAMLEQTAEECVELAHACLKLSRYLRDENEVHGRSEYELRSNLNEEMADVLICMGELLDADILSNDELNYWLDFKKNRMKERLKVSS